MNDLTSRWGHYRSRATDVYHKEGIGALIGKGISFTALLAGTQYWNHRHGSGTSILEKKWDNLLLFDACRYDEFSQVAPYDTKIIGQRITLGSNTAEFMKKTFSGVQLHDTVYITANPRIFKLWDELNDPDPIFHDTISVLDEWDSETITVLPESVVERTLELIDTYPDKRFLIHFIQPHTPFLGPTATDIRQRTGKTIGGLISNNQRKEIRDGSPRKRRFPSYVDAMHAGVSPTELRVAYRETLERVINESQPLVDKLPGKTAITADHGEHLGDTPLPFGSPLWGHPPGIRSTSLCVVPWVEFEFESRKQVTSESPKRQSSLDKELVDERLRSLGYR